MRATRRREGDTVLFVLEDLEERYVETIERMSFGPVEGGFARRFPADLPLLDRAYANFVRNADLMVRQRAGEVPAPWDATLLTVLEVVAGEAIRWYLVGTAALAVRGLPIAPTDVDLVLDVEGARRLGWLLRDHLVEPVTPTPGWVAESFTRAFLSTTLEWLGGANERAEEYGPTDFGPRAAGRLETVVWRGHKLRVPPLDLQLAVNERRGRDRTAALIREALARA